MLPTPRLANGFMRTPTFGRRMLMPFAIIAVVASAVAGPAEAQVAISGAWARATAPGQTVGAVYMSLTSLSDDQLISADSSDAGMTMLHKTASKGGMSAMQDMDALTLPAGRRVSLAPNGMHLMLSGLKHPLAAGQTIHLDLMFAKAGKVAAQVPVLPLGANGPPS